MSDLISRQAAIDELAKFVPYAICDGSTESYTNGLTDAYNLICQLPSAQPEQRWISVTERLPEEERNIYWVYTDFGSMHECRWTNNRFGLGESDTWGWSIFDVPQHSKITHWRELPELPKEEP